MPATRTAQEVRGNLEFSEDAEKLYRADQPAEVLFDTLVKAAVYDDAIRYSSRLLVRPHVIWWGCLCAWHALRPTPKEAEVLALQAVVKWLREPTDANRRDIARLAVAATPTSPAGLVAYAAHMSEGSISPAEKPDVPTDPNFTPQFIANAVLTAARVGPPSEQANRQRLFLKLAADVYRGLNSWKPTPGAG